MTACKCCGGPQGSTNYGGGIGQEMVEQGICFSCHFWNTIAMEQTEKQTHIIVEGVCFTDGGNKPEPDGPDKRWQSLLGHGGRRFHIQMNDGRTVSTNNLWHRGSVPSHFRDRLPNNATLVAPQEA